MNSALDPPMPPAASKQVSLTHPGAPLLTPLEVEVSIDDRHGEVTLSMTEFDSVLVAEYVRHTLPALLGVRVQAGDPERAVRPDADPAHTLVIRLRGRLHPAQVVETGYEQFTVRLGDPLIDLHRRAHETASNVLRALHTRGVESLVVGDVVSDSLNEWNPDSGVEVVLLDQAMADSDLRAMRELAESVATAPVFVSLASGASLFSLLRFGHFVWNADLERVERRHRGADGGRDKPESGDGD